MTDKLDLMSVNIVIISQPDNRYYYISLNNTNALNIETDTGYRSLEVAVRVAKQMYPNCIIDFEYDSKSITLCF